MDAKDTKGLDAKDKEYLEYLNSFKKTSSQTSVEETEEDGIDWSRNPEEIYRDECYKLRVGQWRTRLEHPIIIGW